MVRTILCAGCVTAVALLGCKNESNTGGPSTAPVTTPVTDVAALKAQAEKWMAQVEQAIKDLKWETAESAMAELEKIKPNLPADWAEKIDALSKRLKDAKAAASAFTPKI